MNQRNKILKEVLIITIVSLITGLIVNSVNPKGIPLVRDDGDRFKIDSALAQGSENKPVEKVKTKEGFVKPVNIPVETAKKFFDENAVFIDGREETEFKEGHIKGAINIPYKEFYAKTPEDRQKMMDGIDKNKTIVSYCGSSECEISIDNAYEMAKIGYDNVKIFLGGYREWNELGYPVNK